MRYDVTLRDCGAICTARFNTMRARAWSIDRRDSLTMVGPFMARIAWPEVSRLVACWIADGLTIKGP